MQKQQACFVRLSIQKQLKHHPRNSEKSFQGTKTATLSGHISYTQQDVETLSAKTRKRLEVEGLIGPAFELRQFSQVNGCILVEKKPTEKKSGRFTGCKNKQSAVTFAIYRRFVQTLASQKLTVMLGNKREEAEAFW